ncbi:MAG: hypothetical protein K5894_08665 [Lachnospiraceae bacterium]|nr:hypothetical protein [Lachnospiraceae bacterium]MDN4743768.1 hypothetical protein [Lachnospiraceae bacterium C1.1]
MKDREMIALYAEKTKKMLEGAEADDFSALINALTGLTMYPKGADFDLLPETMAFKEGSKADELLKKHGDKENGDIVDSYFARGFYDGYFRVLNLNEEVNAKTLLLRMRHAVIHTHPEVDIEAKTIAFNDITRFTDMGFWNAKHYFAKDRKNPHKNHKIEKLEEFRAKFTFEEFKILMEGYCELLPEAYPVSQA